MAEPGSASNKSLAYEAFEVPLDDTTEGESLQGAFAKYRRRKKVGWCLFLSAAQDCMHR